MRSNLASCRPLAIWAAIRARLIAHPSKRLCSDYVNLVGSRAAPSRLNIGERRDATQHLAEIMAEFVKRRVDVIVTSATPPTVAAKQATSVIPIVFAAVGDAEEEDWVRLQRGAVVTVLRPEKLVEQAPFSPPGAFGSCS